MDILLGQGMGKIVVVSVFSFVAILIIGILKLISGSYIFSILVFLALVWYLLRLLGTFVMYPGSFFLTRAQMQLKVSKQLGNRIIYMFRAVSSLSGNIMERQYFSQENQFDYHAIITKHIEMMIKMLEMFEDSLSERKKNMIQLYRELDAILKEKVEEGRCISQFINEPRSVITISQSELSFFKGKLQRVGSIMLEIFTIFKTYQPPAETLKLLQFKAYQENLYQIRYAFYNWTYTMNFQIFLPRTPDDHLLQSVIIHSLIKRNSMHSIIQNDSPSKSNRAILFCNPNGVFIQYFGLDNQYIKNYLKLGYKVILWNYRGYGQSTGTPTIKKSQEDAFTIYKYYTEKGYKIEIVHGYSIGGAAAVSIPLKLDKQPFIKNNIEVLIVDRSFSSIGQMSKQFGNTLHNLTKLVFYSQNIDTSLQFQEIRCRKLLIWDNNDQVIPDKSSVKNRIIKRKINTNFKNSIYRSDQDSQRLQLNELIEEERMKTDPDFNGIAHKLYSTMGAIITGLEARRDSEDDQTRRFDAYGALKSEDSTNRSSLNETVDIQELMKMINRIDGGGVKLFLNINQVKKIYKNRPKHFYHICESYVLGLVCYGSHLPLKPIIHDHNKIKEETINKIQTLLNDLRVSFKIDEEASMESLYNRQNHLNHIPNNMYHIFLALSQMVKDCFTQQWFIAHGSLLPCFNGHNQNLSQRQLTILNEFIRNSVSNGQQNASQD